MMTNQNDAAPVGSNEDILYAILIQLSRVYDVLMVGLDDKARANLEEEHAKGHLIGPDIALADE